MKQQPFSIQYEKFGLGHSDLEETTLYLHLSQRRLNATASPLDSLKLNGESPQDR